MFSLFKQVRRVFSGALPERITLELDQAEVAALCAAIPFAYRVAYGTRYDELDT